MPRRRTSWRSRFVARYVAARLSLTRRSARSAGTGLLRMGSMSAIADAVWSSSGAELSACASTCRDSLTILRVRTIVTWPIYGLRESTSLYDIHEAQLSKSRNDEYASFPSSRSSCPPVHLVMIIRCRFFRPAGALKARYTIPGHTRRKASVKGTFSRQPTQKSQDPS
jgi:hypothetical protein